MFSRDVKITVKTDSSARETLASRLGISRKSKHVGLRHLWIQDVLSEGVISLEQVGTHHNPSDVLTKFVQVASLAQHLRKLNLFKDSHVPQVREKLNSIKRVTEEQACRAHTVLSNVYKQVCGQHQGRRFSQDQICVFLLDSFSDQQEALTQHFAKHHFGRKEHSRHLLVEGASIQSQEIQRVFKIKFLAFREKSISSILLINSKNAAEQVINVI